VHFATHLTDGNSQTIWGLTVLGLLATQQRLHSCLYPRQLKLVSNLGTQKESEAELT